MKIYVKNLYYGIILCLVINSLYAGGYTLDDLERLNRPIIPTVPEAMTRRPKVLTPANSLQAIEKLYQNFLQDITPHLDNFAELLAGLEGKKTSELRPFMSKITNQIKRIEKYYTVLLKELKRYPLAIVEENIKKFSEYTIQQVFNGIKELTDIILRLYSIKVKENTIDRIKKIDEHLANILYQARGYNVEIPNNAFQSPGFAGLKSIQPLSSSGDSLSQTAILTEKALSWLKEQGNITPENEAMMKEKISRLVQKKQDQASLAPPAKESQMVAAEPKKEQSFAQTPSIKAEPIMTQKVEVPIINQPILGHKPSPPRTSDTVLLKKIHDVENALIRLKHHLRNSSYR